MGECMFCCFNKCSTVKSSELEKVAKKIYIKRDNMSEALKILEAIPQVNDRALFTKMSADGVLRVLDGPSSNNGVAVFKN